MTLRHIIALGCLIGLSSTSFAKERQHAVEHMVPWQAQIYSTYPYTQEELEGIPRWEKSHRCGGSLIAQGWILTAAHCFDRPDGAKGYKVRMGILRLDRPGGVTYEIGRLIRHPAYDKVSHANDLALLQIVEDDQTNNPGGIPIKPVRLFGSRKKDKALGPDAEVTATGWGKTQFGDQGRFSPSLQMVDLKTLDCDDASAYRGRTTPDMLCAVGTAGGGDACQGDSGGPLVKTYGKPVLVGVVSWGDGCGDATRPGVYIRVDHYLKWIEQSLALNPSGSSR